MSYSYSSPSPGSLVTLVAANDTAEYVVTGMDVTDVPSGVQTEVFISLWEAMNKNGTAKGSVGRLRDGGPTGTVLASFTFPDAGDATHGHQRGWVEKLTVTPATNRLCVTIQQTTGSPQITSDWRWLKVSQPPQAPGYTNPFGTTLRRLYGDGERIIPDLDYPGLTAGVPTVVSLNLWESLDAYGTAKAATARLRDGGPSGTVLASHAFTDAGDSSAGHQQQWSYSATVTPATSRLCVTIETTNTNIAVWSDTRSFSLTQGGPTDVGKAAESGTAQPISVIFGTRSATFARAAEADSGGTITPLIGVSSVVIGQTSESDAARPLAPSFGVVMVPIGQASETDAATGWTFTQPIFVTIGQASEVDTAGTVGIAGMYGVAAAEESDEALAVLVVQAPLRNGIGLALDSSAVLTVEAALEPEPTVPPGTPSTALHIIAPTVPVPTLVAGRPQ